MTTLYLYTEEIEKFSTYSKELQEGWIVEEEKMTATDSAEERSMRMQLMHLRDPKIKQFLESAEQNPAAKDVATLVHNTDLKDIDDADLAELFFALGPKVITLILAFMLKNIKTDDDIEGIVSIALIRHKLLEAFQS